MRLAVIPARGGSKRIPRKNIRLFAGRPIIEYTIEAAIESNVFDQIIVSTDDEEIASVAESAGATAPFRRPAEMCTDTAGSNLLMHHAIDWCDEHLAEVCRACMLPPTAPFLTHSHISDGLQLLEDENAQMTFSVTTFPSPIQRAFEIRDDGTAGLVWPEFEAKRSQELPERYFDASMFYWGLPVAFKHPTKLFPERVVPYPVPRHLVHDIDTEEDWVRAELVFRALNPKCR